VSRIEQSRRSSLRRSKLPIKGGSALEEEEEEEDMFRPYKVILRTSKKTDPRFVYFIALCDPKHLQGFAMKHKNSWICLLGGPEDDLIRSKHVFFFFRR